MINFFKAFLLVALVGVTAACSTTPVTTSSAHQTSDGALINHALYVRAGGNEQLISIVWDNRTGGYALQAVSHNETFIRAVFESIIGNWGPAIIGGIAGIEIAQEGSCGVDANCGTVIWNNGTSSSISGSSSGSVSVSEATASASS